MSISSCYIPHDNVYTGPEYVVLKRVELYTYICDREQHSQPDVLIKMLSLHKWEECALKKMLISGTACQGDFLLKQVQL